MKSTSRTLLALAAVVQAMCMVGCGSGETPATPKQMEEMRQRDMERAKAFQREG